MFYPRIALAGIRSNKKLYYPFYLTCITVVSLFYIMNYISYSETIRNIRAGDDLQLITGLGCYVIALFSVLFLLYTNSFLTKRRMKEYGLYNVLGMSKKNIAFVLFFETLFSSIISLVLGLLFGILLSKLCELLLLKIIEQPLVLEFSISSQGIMNTLKLFAITSAVLYIKNIWLITSSKAVELVKSEEEGEKAPKANWIIGFAGLIILGIAYYMAVSVDNAFGALTMFFFAVLLVIIATYMLFVSGSVVLCRLLQKNKNYYYKTNHFISTSTMSFRMKRNGNGLATICILSTMVLVMISSTAALYFSKTDAINNRYHHEIQTEFRYSDINGINDEQTRKVDRMIETTMEKENIHMTDAVKYYSTPVAGMLKNDYLDIVYSSDVSVTASNIIAINLISIGDYNSLTGKNITMKDDEALLYCYTTRYIRESINIADALNYRLIKMDDDFRYGLDATLGIANSISLVVNNYLEASEKLMNLMEPGAIFVSYYYDFNTEENDETDAGLSSVLAEAYRNTDVNANQAFMSSKANEKTDFTIAYGGLFFLGSVLSVIFIFATVLIIYYKQISEGYEDQNKFSIMKKVGMTTEDIRKTINSQMLTVFYLPIIMAIIHLLFAIPMIRYLLQLFHLTSIVPLLIASGICILVYVTVYAIIYRFTSNTYYSIVNSSMER